MPLTDPNERTTMATHSTLDLPAAVGRFAVSYVRKVCAQAHIGFDETSSGEDVLAVDGTIQYPVLGVRVQIKGSTGPSLTPQTGSLSMPIEPKWREKWRRNGPPVFMIYVLMEHEISSWLAQQPTNTLAGAYALWSRIDNIDLDAESVVFDRTQRFSAETVGEWYESVVLKGYGGGTSNA